MRDGAVVADLMRQDSGARIGCLLTAVSVLDWGHYLAISGVQLCLLPPTQIATPSGV